MKVIPHPTQRGCWTIAITDERGTAIYGCYDRRELAIAVMLTSETSRATLRGCPWRD